MRELFEIPVWSPLYVYRVRHGCARCGQSVHVVALVAEKYDEYYEGDLRRSEEEAEPLGALPAVLLTPVVDLPAPVLEAVQKLHPGYHRGRMSDGTECYANFCACGEMIEDGEVLGSGGPFDVSAADEVVERGIEVVVARFPDVGVVRCDLREWEAIELIHETWWRGVVAELLQRLSDSRKPQAAEHAAALARILAEVDQAREDLRSWRKGEAPRLLPPSSDIDDEEDEAAAEAGFLAWEPLYLLSARHPCWRCGEDSTVAALVAERYCDPWDETTGDDPAGELKHVVRLSDIGRMPPHLEQVLSRVAPGIRIDRSKTAGMSYYMNHCSACGARFGDFFLGEIEGPFWATTPAEFEEKKIRFSVLPVEGPQRLHCGVTASGALEWMHGHWCIQLLAGLQHKLEHRADMESSAFAAAIERLLGELMYLEERIEVERATVYRARGAARAGRSS